MSRSPALRQPIYVDRSSRSLPAWLEVDLGAIRRNARRLRDRASLPIVAMVKADGYGLGMLPVARALGAPFRNADPSAQPTDAPWALGVATLTEAAELREAGCLSRIVVTTPITNPDLTGALELDVRPALHRPEEIVSWSALGGGPWHLSIDTGMSRAGVGWNEVARLGPLVAAHPPEGVFTHFHSAERQDGSREQQEGRFSGALQALGAALPPEVLVHLDNSAAIAAREGGSPGHLVRPGIGLYGSAVSPRLDLEQAVHLRGRVVDVRDIAPGETVSYNATWTASSRRRIATVPIGYADGYRRALSNRGVALLHGQRVPVVGYVTMDMTMIDVTDVARPCAVGDVVTLLGRDGNQMLSTDAVASLAGLSPYELLVGLRLRAPRQYVESATDAVWSAGSAVEIPPPSP